jgi:predicted Zn-dependent protease with MMP-like domain/Flp pilus assembly protein TadD
MAGKPRRKDLPTPTTPDDALAAFDERYDAGDYEGALELAERALKRHPSQAALLHARGLALWGLGRAQSAAEAVRRATELDPTAADAHLDLAALLIDALGQPQEGLERLKAARRTLGEPQHRAAMHALRGHAFQALEDYASAVDELARARRLAPDDLEVALDLAEARIDIFDLDGARRELDAAAQLDPDHARPHFLRAVLLDRDGDLEAAGREFAIAARLDPGEYFVPERLSEEEFDRRVEAAIARIPPRFREQLANVEIAVEPFPADALLRDQGLSPLILGLFVGTPLTDRTFAHTELPPRILVFQRNLENICRSKGELLREIGITVRHEIGHLLGMEEDDLEDAGHG